jgi:peptidoglycan/LPS O-acetylase OafA/YrhL
LKLAPASQGTELEAALAFVVAGHIARAESLAEDLAKRFLLNTHLQTLWLSPIQAQLALYKRTRSRSKLQAATSPIELGQFLATSCVTYLRPHPFFKGTVPTLVSIRAAASAARAASFLTEKLEVIRRRALSRIGGFSASEE